MATEPGFWSFDLAHAVEAIAAFLIAGGSGLWALGKARNDLQGAVVEVRNDLKALTTRIEQFEKAMGTFDQRLEKLTDSLDRLANIAIEIAKQQERSDNFDKRLDQTVAERKEAMQQIDERLRQVEILAHRGPRNGKAKAHGRRSRTAKVRR